MHLNLGWLNSKWITSEDTFTKLQITISYILKYVLNWKENVKVSYFLLSLCLFGKRGGLWYALCLASTYRAGLSNGRNCSYFFTYLLSCIIFPFYSPFGCICVEVGRAEFRSHTNNVKLHEHGTLEFYSESTSWDTTPSCLIFFLSTRNIYAETGLAQW